MDTTDKRNKRCLQPPHMALGSLCCFALVGCVIATETNDYPDRRTGRPWLFSARPAFEPIWPGESTTAELEIEVVGPDETLVESVYIEQMATSLGQFLVDFPEPVLVRPGQALVIPITYSSFNIRPAKARLFVETDSGSSSLDLTATRPIAGVTCSVRPEPFASMAEGECRNVLVLFQNTGNVPAEITSLDLIGEGSGYRLEPTVGAELPRRLSAHGGEPFTDEWRVQVEYCHSGDAGQYGRLEAEWTHSGGLGVPSRCQFWPTTPWACIASMVGFDGGRQEDFGEVTVGSTTSTLVLVGGCSGDGYSPLRVDRIELIESEGAGGSGHFSITSLPPLPAVWGGSRAKFVRVAYSPTEAVGTERAILRIESSALREPIVDIELIGTAVQHP